VEKRFASFSGVLVVFKHGIPFFSRSEKTRKMMWQNLLPSSPHISAPGAGSQEHCEKIYVGKTEFLWLWHTCGDAPML
jgi:hypothetical protein